MESEIDKKIRELTDTYVRVMESYRFINMIRKDCKLTPILASEEAQSLKNQIKDLLFERHIGRRLDG
ncbi:MAG TPA: hypothetical protein VHO03_16780 [Ignavibacteriales bacterium]|nr:hypothetical protein [Ignavibacteriales bacterium]